jgi:MYXO-CTERM domain-containing protein
MRICFLASALALFAGCVPEQGIDRTQQGLGGYQPPAPADTVCLCKGDGGNGTCSADCTSITCDPGFGDCDGRLDTGCESRLDDPSSCGACGNNCHECREMATCNSGTCEGKARPDDSACRAFGCAVVGVCQAGSCVCPGDGVDMAHPADPGHKDPTKTPPGGNDLPGDCSFTGGGTATASMVLLLGAALLLFRRRRRT